MKMFLSIAMLAFAVTAQASPAVGDKASFQGTWNGQDVYQTLALTEYNPQTAQYKKVVVTKIGAAAPQSEEEWYKVDELASDAILKDVVSNCANYNGTPETMTVPAGTFATCNMALEQGGFINVGEVPFAIVRIETPVQGKTFVGVLTSFSRGK